MVNKILDPYCGVYNVVREDRHLKSKFNVMNVKTEGNKLMCVGWE